MSEDDGGDEDGVTVDLSNTVRCDLVFSGHDTDISTHARVRM